MVEPKKIRSLAMRVLNPMESFDSDATPPDTIGDAIGVYDAGDGTVPLWVTTAGVVRDGESGVLRFDAMAEVQAPDSKSREEQNSRRISVIMEDGTREIVVVAGGRGRLCDSFEFSRFLSRAARLSRQ
ncbi:MAG: hypothetical protein R3F61_25090 [Myxococcota bacterium]